MRNKRIAAYLCTGLLLFMAAGCGNSDTDSEVLKDDTINYNNVIDTNAEEDNNDQQNNNENPVQEPNSTQSQANPEQLQPDSNTAQEDSAQFQPDSSTVQEGNAQLQSDNKTSQEDNSQLQSDTRLDGNIESIGDNNIVIDKTLYPSENVAVTSGDLITVYFSTETEFEVWTVKNSGVNGDSDIEKRQGAFSDLKEQVSVKLTGNYDGNDFYAKHVIIYSYV